jgi:hypothetical protein
MEGPLPPDGPMQGLMPRDRQPDWFFAAYDTHHTGTLTHDAVNRAIYARFMAATHGAQTMSEDQFVALHLGEFRQHAAEMFRRLDWSGRGKLLLEDYAAPQRVRFMTLDKDGSGVVSCPQSFGRYRDSSETEGDGYQRQVRNDVPYGLIAFCAANDPNREGKVTRSEFGAVIAKRFASATRGAGAMTEAQFVEDQEQDFRSQNARTFRRLDKDGDGKLTLAEFAAPELKLFARLDRHHDGVVTAEEMHTASYVSRDRGGRRDDY